MNHSMESTNLEIAAPGGGGADGGLEFWGGRVFVCDAGGGFYSLREQMVREIGPEHAADILSRAGHAAGTRLMGYVSARGPGDGREALRLALALLTQSGYGRITVDETRPRPGEIHIKVERSVEGETAREHGDRAAGACDYLRGLLRGVAEALPAAEGHPVGTLGCVETRCVADGAGECRFLLASPDALALQGYRAAGGGHSSVRETLLRLNRQLEEVMEASQRDAMTGLYNRAYFEAALRRRVEYASRRTDTLAVAMIDMDFFKEVNDTQGHGLGDLALRQVAGLLAAQARESDVVARYGGDEFAWLMPGTTLEAALAVAERIRRQAKEMLQEMDLPVSLSIGIAACPDDADTVPGLIDFADTAMYFAKAAGGNQVRRYLADQDYLSTSLRRVRKPRPRAPGGGGPPVRPVPGEEGVLRLDLD